QTWWMRLRRCWCGTRRKRWHTRRQGWRVGREEAHWRGSGAVQGEMGSRIWGRRQGRGNSSRRGGEGRIRHGRGMGWWGKTRQGSKKVRDEIFVCLECVAPPESRGLRCCPQPDGLGKLMPRLRRLMTDSGVSELEKE